MHAIYFFACIASLAIVALTLVVLKRQGYYRIHPVFLVALGGCSLMPLINVAMLFIAVVWIAWGVKYDADGNRIKQ